MPIAPGSAQPLSVDATAEAFEGVVDFTVAYRLTSCKGRPSWSAKIQVNGCSDACDLEGALLGLWLARSCPIKCMPCPTFTEFGILAVLVWLPCVLQALHAPLDFGPTFP